MDQTLTAHAGALAGAIVPLLTQLVKLHLVNWSGKAAQALSLAVAIGAVIVAHVATHTGFAPAGLITDTGLAWSLSQLIYKQVPDSIAAVLVPGR